jgi:hypothetical protein
MVPFCSSFPVVYPRTNIPATNEEEVSFTSNTVYAENFIVRLKHAQNANIFRSEEFYLLGYNAA